jgi:hypothetical protein
VESPERLGDGAYLFPPARRTVSRSSRDQNRMGKLLKRCEISKFRFSRLSGIISLPSLAQAGVDLNTVRELLGHERLGHERRAMRIFGAEHRARPSRDCGQWPQLSLLTRCRECRRCVGGCHQRRAFIIELILEPTDAELSRAVGPRWRYAAPATRFAPNLVKGRIHRIRILPLARGALYGAYAGITKVYTGRIPSRRDPGYPFCLLQLCRAVAEHNRRAFNPTINAGCSPSRSQLPSGSERKRPRPLVRI